MHVLATAGHVDHGKSTLVKALTGMEPDRYEEERRRGLTIDLGFAWTRLDGVEVALVDVPGHERFVTTMLAGVGPVPAVLFVVAADGGWMPQSGEHLDALAALGVDRGLLVVTRADLADPGPALAAARAKLAGTSLAGVQAVAVSARTGAGMDPLRSALARVVASLPTPDPHAAVRLWVDRSFTVRGAGTVVTGTLPAGTVRVGDELAVCGGARVSVRGLHRLGRPAPEAAGVARVALNLRGVSADALSRGEALTTPGAWRWCEQVDVRLRPVGARAPAGAPVAPAGSAAGTSAPGSARRADQAPLPEHLVLHVGSAAVPVRVRVLAPSSPPPPGEGRGDALGDGGGAHARLSLSAPLPLRVGDVGALRDPGAHAVVTGVVVLDPAPPPLARRGAARARDAVLAGLPVLADAAGELSRREVVRAGDLRVLGVPGAAVDALAAALPGRGGLVAGGWLVDPGVAARLRAALSAEVAAHAHERPLDPALPLPDARRRLVLPAVELVAAVAALPGPPLLVREGRVGAAPERTGPAAGPSGPPAAPAAALPAPVRAAVEQVLADLADEPFAAPDANRLRGLGLGARELAAAVRAGALERVGDGVYLAPGVAERAAAALAGLPQPFTLSQARTAWGTSRRVALPLAALLDARRLTVRQTDDTRRLA